MNTKSKLIVRSVFAVAALAVVANYAFAWTAPTAQPTGGNVPAPINTGSNAQTKNADLNLVGSLTTTNNAIIGKTLTAMTSRLGCGVWTCTGILGADVLLAGKHNGTSFTGVAVSPSGTTAIGVQNNYGQSASLDTFPGGPTFSKGLSVVQGVVNIVNSKLTFFLEGNSGVAGRNALEVRVSSDNVNHDAGAVFLTNAKRFSFRDNTSAGNLTGIAAKNIQLTEGAGQGKVLTSDADGNASWQGGNQSVEITGGMFKYVAAESNDATVSDVYCGDGWIAVSGGGFCRAGVRSSTPILNMSGDVPGSGTNTFSSQAGPAVGWRVTCLTDVLVGPDKYVSGNGGGPKPTYANAVCMKNVPLVSYQQTTSPGTQGGTGNNGGTTPSWGTPLTVGTADANYGRRGVMGQTCQQFLAGTSYTIQRVTGTRGPGVIPVNPITSSSSTNTCLYVHANPVTKDANISMSGVTQYRSKCQVHDSNYSNSVAMPVTHCDNNAEINGDTSSTINLNLEAI